MSTETLTSLAMLKVHVDRGQDYLDYLRPFVLQVLVVHKPDPITDATVRDLIRVDFGLEIPDRAVQVVLKRLSRQYPLKKDRGVYRINGELPDPRIAARKAEALRHIRAVLSGLVEFSMGTPKPIVSDDEAVNAICAFLTQFNIPCLRAYLRGRLDKRAVPSAAELPDGAESAVAGRLLCREGDDPPVRRHAAGAGLHGRGAVDRHGGARRVADHRVSHAGRALRGLGEETGRTRRADGRVRHVAGVTIRDGPGAGWSHASEDLPGQVRLRGGRAGRPRW